LKLAETINVIEISKLITDQKESGQFRYFSKPSASVPKAGIEPAHPKIHDFESCASTSSATLAFCPHNLVQACARWGLIELKLLFDFSKKRVQICVNFASHTILIAR
jgi:hypothetical protein